jgi:hypothetical protein
MFIKPTRIIKNYTMNTPNVTMTFWPALPFSQVFLLKLPLSGKFVHYSCTTPPPTPRSTIRTAVFTLNSQRAITFNPRHLEAGIYAVCYRNFTAHPVHLPSKTASHSPTDTVSASGTHTGDTKTATRSRTDTRRSKTPTRRTKTPTLRSKTPTRRTKTLTKTLSLRSKTYHRLANHTRNATSYRWGNHSKNSTFHRWRNHSKSRTLHHSGSHSQTSTFQSLSRTVSSDHSRTITYDAGDLKWFFYSQFIQLRVTVTIVNYILCRGSRRRNFGICAVNPAFASSGEGNRTTVALYYAAKGTQAFLLKRHINGVTNPFNCTRPPQRSWNIRTPVATVGDVSRINFDFRGLESGTYTICFKNRTSANFVPLTMTMTVSGAIDALKTKVDCCNGPWTVGQRVYCQIRAVDSSGLPAGGLRDACDFRACPITDGAGQGIQAMQPYFVGVGLFEFWFVAERSGCGASVGVSYKGAIVGGNSVQYLTILPGAIDYKKSTSNCTWTNGLTTCRVISRDTYGNPVAQCAVQSTGKIYCNKFTAHQIDG